MDNLKINTDTDSLNDIHQKLRTLLTTNEAQLASLAYQLKRETSDARRGIQDSTQELQNLRNELQALQNKRSVNDAEISITLERQRGLTELSLAELRNSKMEFLSNFNMISLKRESHLKELRLQLVSAQLERDMLQDELETIKSRWEKSNLIALQEKLKCKNIQSMQFSALLITNCLGLILVIAITVFTGLITLDGLCAPVMPGTILKLENNFYSEAPWWWSISKENAFLVCGQRRRTSLSWNRGRLLILDLKTQKPLVDKRVASGLIKDDSIHIFGKRSQMHAFRSPWKLA
jgi:hypothetical protein